MGYMTTKTASKDLQQTINFVFFSPHFPPRWRFFVRALRQRGVNVLGIGDEHWDLLHHDLKENLREYYRIGNLEDYDQVYRAVGYFVHKYGRIHFIESLNEHWLELEAALRLDFNVPGYKPAQMEKYKRKSGMKVIFKEAGLAVVPGVLASSLTEAIQFARTVGYPLILKPDIGVGGYGARKIQNEDELRMHWEANFFLEQFIKGQIETFDGLTNDKGDIIFYASLGYSNGIMEILQTPTETVYFNVKKEVPEDLRILGTKVVKAFDVKSRFFHIEFFRTADGTLYPLEMNLRPPGGITVDLWNYAHRTDMYAAYADVITNQPIAPFKRPEHICLYCGRRRDVPYKHQEAAVAKKLGKKFELRVEIPRIFSPVVGDDAYVILCDTYEEMKDVISFMEEREKKVIIDPKEKMINEPKEKDKIETVSVSPVVVK